MQEIKTIIVEDDPMVAEINKTIIDRIGRFTITGIFRNEDEAYEFIQNEEPDLILLDITLTTGNGINLLNKIRRNGYRSDVILITASNDTKTIYQSLNLGIIDYIIKPFDLDRLTQSLTQYLDLRKALVRDGDISQEELDELNKIRQINDRNRTQTLPKGIHESTLNQILLYLNAHKVPQSAKQISEKLNVSSITTWRYLEYLSKEDRVKVRTSYGVVGRPTKLYYLRD